ncbi:uncharacterized protein LOC131215963 [Anopheles bellator]|uniref:uncharacterized protein LOC131215963 n=1 Tax=Anopheles bellator TaxID=139047 RepID=UPI002649D8BE|nr:uncharacterized protein LOC131215963 [Anopheles bellator]
MEPLASELIASNLLWIDYQEHLLRTYRTIYENEQYADCTLVLADGQQKANSAVLGLASGFFERIFAVSGNVAAPRERFVVMIPDMSLQIMQHVLLFIHTGEIILRSNQMSCFVDACSLLELRGMKTVGSVIVGMKVSALTMASHETAVLGAESGSAMHTQCLGEDWFPAVSAADVEGRQSDGTVEQSLDGLEANRDSQYFSLDAVAIMDEDTTELSDSEGNNEQLDMSTALANNSGCKATTKEGDGRDAESSASSNYSDRLEKAVFAIVTGKMSFRVAARTFSVSKSVLWRRTVNEPGTRIEKCPELPPSRLDAIEAIKAGEKLLNVNRRFGIPLGTLHRDKIRLYNKGHLPETVKLKHKDINYKQRVSEAAQQCITGMMSLTEATRSYSIPTTTIWRRIQTIRADADGATKKRSRSVVSRRKGTQKSREPPALERTEDSLLATEDDPLRMAGVAWAEEPKEGSMSASLALL